MDLYLQMGHGMESMCLELLKHWNQGTVIFSPVNTRKEKLASLSERYHNQNGSVMFDPQLYYPRDGAEKLKEYEYWPNDSETLSDVNAQMGVFRGILSINEKMNTEAIILPGSQLDVNSFRLGIGNIKLASKYFREHTDKDLLATICLYTEVVRSPVCLEELIEELKEIDVDGFYVVLRASNEEYIISDTLWMVGFAKLLACLKLMKKKVVVAYSNHQGLIAGLAHVDAICSGNYMNTRRFDPKRFQSKKADIDMRKSIWYFHPHALSEYKASLLDLAFSRGYLDTFRPLGEYQNEYSDMLFSGALPSSTSYSEPNSFKHYLHCMKILCNGMCLDTYDNTISNFWFLLNTSEKIMHEYGVRGLKSQNRDFGMGIEAMRIAANAMDEDYGFRLRIDWSDF